MSNSRDAAISTSTAPTALTLKKIGRSALIFAQAHGRIHADSARGADEPDHGE